MGWTGQRRAAVAGGEAEHPQGAPTRASWLDQARCSACRRCWGPHVRSARARPGADAVVVFSHAAWRHHFGGSPHVLGQSVTLDGRAYTVIGVMPHGFQFPTPRAEIWTPFVLPTSDPHPRARVPLIARVKDDVSMAAAAEEVRAILSLLREAEGASAQTTEAIATPGSGPRSVSITAPPGSTMGIDFLASWEEKGPGRVDFAGCRSTYQ